MALWFRKFLAGRRGFPILCLFGALIGAYLITLPLGLHPASTLPKVASTLPKIAAASSALPQQDQAFFLFALWWTPHALFDLHTDPWFCPYLGAPEGVSLLFSTIVPLLGVASAPLTRGLAPALGVAGALVLACNAWTLLAIALTAFFTALVVRELGGSRGGALVAAAILFYPSVLRSQLGHLNILSAYWVPLGYFLYLRFLRTWRAAWALAAGASFAGVFYDSAYHAVHLSLLVGLDAAWRLWLARGPALRRCDRWLRAVFAAALALGIPALSFSIFAGLVILVGGIGLILLAIAVDALLKGPEARFTGFAALGLLVASALVSPFFIEQRLDPRHKGLSAEMAPSPKVYFSAQPLSYVLSPKPTRFLTSRGYLGGNDLMGLSAEGETSCFPGYAVWTVFLATLFLSRRKGRRGRGARYLVFALVFAALSLGPILRWGRELAIDRLPEGVIVLPPFLFQFLPFLDGYRVFARMGFMAFLCAAVFVGLRWPRTAGRWGARRRGALTLLALAAIVGERAYLSTPTQPVRVPPLYERLAASDEKLTLMEFPFHKAQYLLPLAIHRHALANYYVSRVSIEKEKKSLENTFFRLLFLYDHPYPRRAPVFDRPPSPAQLRADFRALGLDGVIVHADQLAPGEIERFDSFLTGTIGLRLADRDSSVLFYRVPRPESGR